MSKLLVMSLTVANLALLIVAVFVAINELRFIWSEYLWPVRLGGFLIALPLSVGLVSFLIARTLKKRSVLESFRAFHIGLFIALITVFVVFFTGPSAYIVAKGSYAELHNLRIDLSCTTDSDCVVKPSGCDCCGYTSACMNKDSAEGMCGLTASQMMCDCLPYYASNCVCVDNLCQSGGTPAFG